MSGRGRARGTRRGGARARAPRRPRFALPPDARVLVAQCRPGFETECAGELRTAASGQHRGRIDEYLGEGYVVMQVAGETGALGAGLAWAGKGWRDLVFSRQLFWSAGELSGLSPGDRAAPLVAAARALAPSFSEVFVEHPDGPAGRPLARLCRGLAPALDDALAAASALGAGPRLHLLMVDSLTCFAGVSDPAITSPWPMGIPRLRSARDAPSRSAMKLEEAFTTVLPADAARLVRPGMRAVDLGASPGGWTWVLARRGLSVEAVDNGPLRAAALEAGRVAHVRADAFRYRPRRQVDWMTCDVADKPARVSALVARWLCERWCRAAVFNLKLPMRRRLVALDRSRAEIERALAAARVDGRLVFKQLYHDREEVTGVFTPR